MLLVRRSLFAWSLWLALLPLVLQAAYPKRAEAALPIGAAVAACAASPSCVAFVAGGLAAVVAAATSPVSEAVLANFADMLHDTWNDLTAPEQAAVGSLWNDASGILTVTPELLAQWETALASVTLPAHVSYGTRNYPTGTPYSGTVEYDDRSGAPVAVNDKVKLWMHVSAPTLDAQGSCAGTTRITFYTTLVQSGNSPTVQPRVGESYLDSTLYTPGGSYGLSGTGQTFAFDVTSGGASTQYTALCAGDGWVRQALYSTTYGGSYYNEAMAYGMLKVEAHVGHADAATYLYPAISYIIEGATDDSPALPAVAPGTARQIYPPANTDDLIDKMAGAVVTRTDGTTGTLLGGTVGAEAAGDSLVHPDSRSWWEGLTMIGGVITGVQAVYGAIQALPNRIVDALEAKLTTWFVPTVAVQTRVIALGDVLETRAPFAWYTEVTGVFGDLFSAEAAGCVDFEFPQPSFAAAAWGADTPIEFCAPEGASDITIPISQFVAILLVVLYAMSRVYGFLNGGVKDGTQMKMFD